MGIKLFAGSMIALNNNGDIYTTAVAVSSNSEYAAIGLLHEEIRRINPPSEGWNNYTVNVCQFGDAAVERAYLEIQKSKEES